MKTPWRSLLTSNHLKQTNYTYKQHCGRALKFSMLMLKGCLASLVHAFIPDLFIDTTTKITKQLNDELK